MILSNIDPKCSPENDLILDKLRTDEKCLAVYDQRSKLKLIILHENGCWGRDDHSCEDLPPEDALQETEYASIDSNKTLHMDIGMIVLGDLSVAGCYVDWAAAKNILAGQKTT